MNQIQSLDQSIKPLEYYEDYFSEDCNHSTCDLEKLVELLPSTDYPFSMNIRSLDELSEMLDLFSRIMDSHYNFGLKVNMKNEFPYYCCERSSHNVNLVLLAMGFHNSTFIETKKLDHCFIVLPFQISKDKVNGYILLDPTHDQYYNGEINKRNLVSVQFNYSLNEVYGDLFEKYFDSPFVESQTNRIMTYSHIRKHIDQNSSKNSIDMSKISPYYGVHFEDFLFESCRKPIRIEIDN